MRYFVTGATGFLGGRLAEQLLAAGHQVHALVRDPARAEALGQQGARLFAGDVTDRESLRAPMSGLDGVFHVAGWYKLGLPRSDEGRRINVDGTRNVLEMMLELGVPKGVYTSTLAINSHTGGRLVDESYHYDGPHLSEYDRTKAEAHRIADAMIAVGLPLVIVMPGLIYGPGDTSSLRPALIQYLHCRLPMAPLQTAFCWGHVSDIAGAHILAMERGRIGETYIIAGPAHTFVEAMEMAESITGRPAPRLRLPPAAVRVTAALMGLLEKVAPVPQNFTSEYLRVNGGTTYLGDNSKARRELGYTPRPLRQGLEETLRHEMALLGMETEERG